MKKTKWLLEILFMVMSIVSCQKDDTTNKDGLSPSALKSTTIATPSKGLTNMCGTTVTLPLLTSKAVQLGTVEIGNDKTNLNFTYTTTLGTFGTLILFIGNDLAALPINEGSGNPVWGLFPYKSGKTPFLPAKGLIQYTFTIPLASINPDFVFNETVFYIVARAEIVTNADAGSDGVLDTESALAGNLIDNSGKKPVRYDTYTININDFTVPENGSSIVPFQATIEAPALPVVSDACGNVLTPSDPAIANNLLKDGSGTVIYTYTYTDAAMHSHDWTYTYTVPIYDIEGNIYHTVVIGTQTWMLENLKTTKYNDGTPILYAPAWSWSTADYLWYNNDPANRNNSYGALYSWYAVNTGKLAPAGWHVPALDEWLTLANYLGGYLVAGGKMKEAGLIHWNAPNTDATNESGFTAIAAGWNWDGSGQPFMHRGDNNLWWSSTPFPDWGNYRSWYFCTYNTSGTLGYSHDCRWFRLSVRCIRD